MRGLRTACSRAYCNSIHPPFSFATEALSCPVFQSSALLAFQPCCSIGITVPLHLPPRLIFAAWRPHCALRSAWLPFHANENSHSVLHDQQRSALSSLNPSSGRLNKTRLLPCFHCYWLHSSLTLREFWFLYQATFLLCRSALVAKTTKPAWWSSIVRAFSCLLFFLLPLVLFIWCSVKEGFCCAQWWLMILFDGEA